jgi:hypothetical protein
VILKGALGLTYLASLSWGRWFPPGGTKESSALVFLKL